MQKYVVLCIFNVSETKKNQMIFLIKLISNIQSKYWTINYKDKDILVICEDY